MWSILIDIIIVSGLIFLIGVAVGKLCQLSNDDRNDFPKPRPARRTQKNIVFMKQRGTNKRQG